MCKYYIFPEQFILKLFYQMNFYSPIHIRSLQIYIWTHRTKYVGTLKKCYTTFLAWWDVFVFHIIVHFERKHTIWPNMDGVCFVRNWKLEAHVHKRNSENRTQWNHRITTFEYFIEFSDLGRSIKNKSTYLKG